MRGASIVTPFFIWFYLLVALVLFVNLLIAMFNAEFEHVMAKADANVRLAKVHQVQHCKRLSPPFTSSLSLSTLHLRAQSVCSRLCPCLILRGACADPRDDVAATRARCPARVARTLPAAPPQTWRRSPSRRR